MLNNYLSVSGTVSGIRGNDAYSPKPYWDSYTYRQLTSNETSALRNNNYLVNAFTLSPGQYTCLEIVPSGSVYVGAFRTYFGATTNTYDYGLAIQQSSQLLSTTHITYSGIDLIDRENQAPHIAYWKQYYGAYGYFESSSIDIPVGETIDLIDTSFFIITLPDIPEDSVDLTNQSIRQFVLQPADSPVSDFIQIELQGPSVGTTSLKAVSIAPISVTASSINFDECQVTDHDVRGAIRYWKSDGNNFGHFEGRDIWLDVGQPVEGTWTEDVTWSGTGSETSVSGKGGYTVRQLVPTSQLEVTGDGLRAHLRGSSVMDVQINHISYMPANSSRVTLDFQTNSDFEQLDLKGNIVRWKNDGIVQGLTLQGVNLSSTRGIDQVDIIKSQHYGHFEEGEVDFDDGQSAIMYDPNIIGFRCTNHGLEAGDFIAVYGTNYYNGHYIVLTYSTAHIIVVWGIYDPEVFTSTAKLRKIVSLGPETDVYGLQQGSRDVVPYCQVNFTDGSQSYIISYADYGKRYASVEMSTVASTQGVSSIYDVFYDSAGYLSSTPGPSITPDYETNIPYPPKISNFKSRSSFSSFVSIDYEHDDPGWGLVSRSPDSWRGKYWVITEAQDPYTAGDQTGWKGMGKFFDRQMAQPPSTLAMDCPWLNMCYRGPMPVKFFIDMGGPKSFSKYRLWIQMGKCQYGSASENFCNDTFPVSYPKSWMLQGSNVESNNDGDWTTLHHVTNHEQTNFVPESLPPDHHLPSTVARGLWFEYPVTTLYRYYRLYVYDVWQRAYIHNIYNCSQVVLEDTTNISEMDFVEHFSGVGLFPTVVTSSLRFDRIDKIEPLEHMLEGSTAYYALSFDNTSYYAYKQGNWRLIVRNFNGTWQYYRDTWKDAQVNNARKALWHAFSSATNRMTALDLSSVPASAYSTLVATSGTYLTIGVGLVSQGIMESLLSGINVYGSIYNPNGIASPTELTVSGSIGYNILCGEKVISDWINVPVEEGNDLLFVFDVDGSSDYIDKRENTSVRYFERPKYTSYDRQTVAVSDFTLNSGILFVDSVDVRSSDLVILPAQDHGLLLNDIVSVTGTHYCEGRHELSYVETHKFGYTAKHYQETISAGAVARQLLSVGPLGINEPDVQAGSILAFSGTGAYDTETTSDVTPSGFYFVTESRCQPGKEATYLFDSDSSVEFHSLDPIGYGPVHIGVYIQEPRAFNKLRIKSSNNYYYWDKEFPKDIQIAVSTSGSPALTNDLHWTPVYSGVCSLPAGPENFCTDFDFSVGGSFQNYRITILSSYGESTDCIRMNKMELYDTSGLLQGFTALDDKQGFDTRYLFDDTTYSQFVSNKPLASGVVNIGIDFRGKPTTVTSFNLTAVVDAVSPVTRDSLSYQKVSPKVISFWLSRLVKPDLNNDSQWTKTTTTTYAQPASPGIQGSTITLPYPPLGAITQTEGILVGTNTVAGVSGRTTLDASWSLDNGQVIKEIGFGSPRSGNYLIKLCKDTGDEIHWDVIQDVVTVNFPSAINYQYKWTVLDTPLLVPSSGKYCLAVYFSGAVGSYAKSSSNWLHYTGEATVGLNRLFSYYTTAYTLPLAVRYMADGEIPIDALNAKLKIESVWGGVTYNAELAEMNFTTEERLQNYNVITYSGITYPFKLLDLPPNYRVTGGTIAVPSGFAGGYVEEAGTVVPVTTTGSYLTSFWTIVDKHWQLENGKSIAQIGIDCNTATSLKTKIFKKRNEIGTRFDISEIATLAHTGSGFQWFTLSAPYAVPNDGEDYYLGWYQANYPRYMGDATGSGLVSYEFGDLTGAYESLPLSNDMKPHLGVRYANYYSIGVDSASGILYPLLSPCTDGATYYITNTYGPLTQSGAVYLYRPCTFIQPNTKGYMNITLNYEDVDIANYGAWTFTTSGTQSGVQTASFIPTHSVKDLFDNSVDSYYYGYRMFDVAQHLRFGLRFDESAYLTAYRLRSSPLSNSVNSITQFPRVIEVGGATEPLLLSASLGWEDLYYDEGYASHGFGVVVPTSTWMPWVYIDDYTTSGYKYYKFDLCHMDQWLAHANFADLDMLVRQTTVSSTAVTSTHGVIQNIVSNGLSTSGVQLLYNTGDVRAVSAVYNTFTHHNQIELSPGTYFYRGENNESAVSPTPQDLYLEVGDDIFPITFTLPEMSNMQILAWHTLDEETGDFADLSGNDVIGSRVGGINSMVGKSNRASYIDNNDLNSKNIIFTLPSRLTEYSVAFWFKPIHTLNTGSSAFDIMGGWITLGAVPGIWHLSFRNEMVYFDSPYPVVQYSYPLGGNFDGRFVFGNYGASVATTRQRWPYQTWHHIAFSFKSDGSRKVWIDGALDPTTASEYSGSNIYPGDTVIIPDVGDISYADHGYNNTMYFGLPFEGADGMKGEYALDNIMHFGKVLTDADVFRLYRTRNPRLENDGIYFANKLPIAVPSRVIVDFGSEICLTQVAIQAAYSMPNPGPGASWTVSAFTSEEEWIPITVHSGTVNPPEGNASIPWVNFVNKGFYTAYSLDFWATSSGLDLSSIHFSEVPFIPSVSGSYVTYVSGIDLGGQQIAHIDVPATGSGYMVDYSNDGSAWIEVLPSDFCGYKQIGLSSLYFRNTFSGSVVDSPVVYPYLLLTTDWSTSIAPVSVLGATVLPEGDSVSSDFIPYTTSGSQLDMIVMDIDSGMVAFTGTGAGYLLGAGESTSLSSVVGYDHSCSGTFALVGMILRSDDLIAIPYTTAPGAQSIDLEGIATYSGVYIVEAISGSKFQVRLPYLYSSTPAGWSFRNIYSGDLYLGETVKAGGYSVQVSGTAGYLTLLSSGIVSQTVSGIYNVAPTGSGIGISVTSSGTLTSGSAYFMSTSGTQWAFSHVGRVVGITPNVTLPAGTEIYHGLTFDGGVNYKIFKNEQWTSVIRNNSGQWQYYEDSWTNAPTNTPYSAFKALLASTDDGMSTSELLEVRESEWHADGGLASSGTLGFIQCLQGHGTTTTPRLYSYDISYVDRTTTGDQTWSNYLIPSGYGFTTNSGVAGGYISHTFTLDTGNERIYGGKYTDRFRLYLANPSRTTNLPVTEVAMLNTIMPNDNYYLPAFTHVTKNCPVMTSGSVLIPELSDEHIHSGGVIVPEQSVLLYEMINIPTLPGIYFGDFRIYFDPTLDTPDLLSIATSSGSLGSYSFSWSYSDSAHEATHPFSASFDGSVSTGYWSGYMVSNNGPYLYMTFGVSYSINRFRFMSHNWNSYWDRDYPKEVYLYYSDNGSNWTQAFYSADIGAAPGSGQWGAWKTVAEFGPHKYWRFWIKNARAYSWVGFSETGLDVVFGNGPSYLGSSPGLSFFTPQRHSDYYSCYFWGNSPITKVAACLANINALGSGIARITETAVFPLDSDHVWDIPNNFNLLESAYSYSTSYTGSPYSSYAYYPLSTPHLENIFDPALPGAIPIMPSGYIGIYSNMQNLGAHASEFRLYLDSASGTNSLLFTQVSGSSSWRQHTPTWSGSYYSVSFPAENITSSRIYCLNTATGTTYTNLRWARALQLINESSEVDFGSDGTGSGTLDLPTNYYRYDRIQIFNNNRSGLPANARVLPRYSNNYHLDRLVKISEDMTNWSHLDIGVCLPEDLPFELGTTSGTYVTPEETIQLLEGTTSGTWTSPVVESLDPSSNVAYIYCNNLDEAGAYVNKDLVSAMNIVEVRTSYSKPMHSFLVTAVDTENILGAQVLWKTVAFDSDGSVSSWTRPGGGTLNVGTNLSLASLADLDNIGSSYYSGCPRRYWPYSSRVPLWQFYGTMDSRRYASITLGLENGGDVLNSTGYGRNEDIYRLRSVFPSTQSFSDGLQIPDTNYLHIYPRTNPFLFPIFAKSLRYTMRTEGGVLKPAWHAVDVVCRTSPFYERYQEDYFSSDALHLRNLYSFVGNSNTPEYSTEIDYLYSFPGSYTTLMSDQLRIGACRDNQGLESSYWVHYANAPEADPIYITLLISEDVVVESFTNIERSFNYLVEGSPVAPRGFWGIEDRCICWAEYNGTSLVERYVVTTDDTGKDLKLVTFGNIDANNNLWVVDLATERVLRINFESLQSGGTAVDYNRTVEGACSVYPDPYDGSAYIYVIKDPEFPDSDCVKIVHLGDYDYITPDVVCTVPGIPIVESYNVNLYGRSIVPEGYYSILPQDSVWKSGGTATWQYYSAGSPTLPKGPYKQFRVTLQAGTQGVSPEVEKIRIPIPALLNKIPYRGYKDVWIDTLPHEEEVILLAGDYTLDLLVWWPRE
jgi:hypothetical protein